MRAFACALAVLGCVAPSRPGDPAPPAVPQQAPRGSLALPGGPRWDGTAYCRKPFSGPFGWLDPIGHIFGITEPVEHLAMVAHDIEASGVVVPSPVQGANDEVDIDGDWNWLIQVDTGMQRLLNAGNFDPDYGGGLGAELVASDMDERVRPRPGDRVWIRGDWVADCWHDIAQAEIHPAFATLVVRADEQQVNFVRKSGVWTDLLDGVVDHRVDPAEDVTFSLVPAGTPGPGQTAVAEELERAARQLIEATLTPGAGSVALHVRIREDGAFYARYRVTWR
jgi:hypothetical protein